MQYSACLNPIQVWNKYTKSYVSVPCRKCDACRATAKLGHVSRLQETRLHWQDCIFFTLTYAPEYVPKVINTENFVFHSIDKIGLKNRPNYVKKDGNSEFIKYENLLSREDAKRFMDSLRAAVGDCVVFITGEYGPNTFRPHYHGEIFFNKRGSERVIEIDRVSRIILQVWSTNIRSWLPSYKFRPVESLGFVVTRYDDQVSASYTAQYVNCNTDLPLFLQRIAPQFSMFSRNLSASYECTDLQLHELLYSGVAVSRPVYVKRQGVSVFDGFTILPLSVLYRYFPRFTGSDRITLSGFSELLWAVESLCLADFKVVVRFQPYSKLSSVLRRLFMCSINELTDEQLDSMFYVFRSIRKRVKEYYHGDVKFYFDIYQCVFSSVKLFKLRQFYELQQQIADDKLVDSRFINGLYHDVKDESLLPFKDSSAKWFDLNSNPLVAKYALKMKKICLDNTKTKKRNDYLNLI